jgi:hypothetical protein
MPSSCGLDRGREWDSKYICMQLVRTQMPIQRNEGGLKASHLTRVHEMRQNQRCPAALSAAAIGGQYHRAQSMAKQIQKMHAVMMDMVCTPDHSVLPFCHTKLPTADRRHAKTHNRYKGMLACPGLA